MKKKWKSFKTSAWLDWTQEIMDWFEKETLKWVDLVHLTDWIVTVRFWLKPFEEEMKIWDGNWVALATTSPDPTYKKAVITYYPSILEEYKWARHPSYTVNCIKHEVCHMITAKIWEIAKDRYASEKEIDNEIETLTQTLSVLLKEDELQSATTTRASKMNKVLAKPKKQAKHSSPKLHSWPRKRPRKKR